MTPTMVRMQWLRGALVSVAAFVILLAGFDSAAAQPRRQRAAQAAQAGADNPGADPAELGRLFDAYAVMQAQEVLGLDEESFGRFVTRLRALQQLRRRHLRERTVLMREMRQLLQGSATDAQLAEKTSALARLEQTIWDDERKAREFVDDVLTVKQRARFRLLEQQLELRKLELVNRARARLRAPRP
jgi:hypothetical protein